MLSAHPHSPVRLVALSLLLAVGTRAQDRTPPLQALPEPGCAVSSVELERNRKLVMEFFRVSGAERVALLDASYKQHNPEVLRRAKKDNLSDYEEVKKLILAQATGPVRGLGLGPTPPGNRFEIVTAECDIVTVVHQDFRHDPTGESKFYEAFTFDTFRVKGGRLVEHWDGSALDIPPPASTETRHPPL